MKGKKSFTFRIVLSIMDFIKAKGRTFLAFFTLQISVPLNTYDNLCRGTVKFKTICKAFTTKVTTKGIM